MNIYKNRVLGIDENGLGPLMGPLVITGVLLRQGEQEVWFDDISDSKKFFSRNTEKFSQLEEVAASLFYLCEGREPSSPAEILATFCKGYGCLSGLNICTDNIPQEFIWSGVEGRKRRYEQFLKWMNRKGMEIEGIESVALCPRRINGFTEKGNHKFLLDLSAFCEIIKGIHNKDLLSVYAGRVGGLKFYRKYLCYYIPDYKCVTIEEKKDASLYRMEGDNEVFTLGFYTDVEDRFFSAALSSLAGKYIRELFMTVIKKTLGISEDISGYYDSKTMSYIANTSFGDIPSECIFRRR
ncbi:MAG: hypothetical protein PHI44_01675 [Candidatus Ratteibacteria bacterium]|nr:hypothetical protein [Candidatus Ratteibacteria bacterium]